MIFELFFYCMTVQAKNRWQCQVPSSTMSQFPDEFIIIIITITVFITYGAIAMFNSICLNILKLSTKLKSGKALSPLFQTALN